VIPKTFHLIWSGGPISFLRYTTFATLRHHHPTWQIKLHLFNKFGIADWDHENISQDFAKAGIRDYLPNIRKLVNEVCPCNLYQDMAPTYQTDFLRWDILDTQGGFYLDTDQVILKPFDDLCNNRFVYSDYEDYTPTGVLGAEPRLPLSNLVRYSVAATYQISDYCSTGPHMLLNITKKYPELFVESGILNTGRLFYPVYPWEEAFKGIYDGSFVTPASSYALHWFGAHNLSQDFNVAYSESCVKDGTDEISRSLKRMHVCE
jgi:mannosyltransferase OCH1-like enzyme